MFHSMPSFLAAMTNREKIFFFLKQETSMHLSPLSHFEWVRLWEFISYEELLRQAVKKNHNVCILCFANPVTWLTTNTKQPQKPALGLYPVCVQHIYNCASTHYMSYPFFMEDKNV